MLLVEPEEEVHIEPVYIIDKREIMLWKWEITQVKVQWEHYTPEEATWEEEEDMG